MRHGIHIKGNNWSPFTAVEHSRQSFCDWSISLLVLILIMPSRHSTGMHVAHIGIRRGGKLPAVVGAVVLLMLLSGCQPATLVELQNETGTTVSGQDFKKGW